MILAKYRIHPRHQSLRCPDVLERVVFLTQITPLLITASTCTGQLSLLPSAK